MSTSKAPATTAPKPMEYCPSDYFPKPLSVAAQNEAAWEDLVDSERPKLVDRWTTTTRSAFPHPGTKMGEGSVDVLENVVAEEQQATAAVNGNSSALFSAEGGEPHAAPGEPVRPVTRSASVQTRPPFAMYRNDTKNVIPTDADVIERIMERQAARAEEEPEMTTSREVGASTTNHVLTRGNPYEYPPPRPTVGRYEEKIATIPTDRVGRTREIQPSARRPVSADGRRNRSDRTVSRRWFCDTATQTTSDPVKVSAATANLSGDSLYTTNLFLCGFCHAVLRSNSKDPVCDNCGNQMAMPLFTSKPVNAPGFKPVEGVTIAVDPQPQRARSPPRARTPTSANGRRSRTPSPAKRMSAQECFRWVD